MNIKDELFALQDTEYREFNSRLLPNIDKSRMIGIRTPMLRALAKRLRADDGYEEFIHSLPHHYYEENALHAYAIALEKDYDKALFETKRFLPYIDNWAVCDTFRPRVFNKNKEQLLPELQEWLKGESCYTIRFGLNMLMSLFLDEDFKPEYLEWAALIKSEEYYVNMMIAWYFATALAKQYETAMPYIAEGRLDIWVHNKTIQKACESRRVSDGAKAQLKTFRIKV